jgi:hypothetical protein
MIDKDQIEDDMLSKNFPGASILYCFWNVFKSLKKNYGKSSDEFQVLQRMMYSLTE